MMEDRLEELEARFDELKDIDETAAKNLGMVIDRIEDGKILAAAHIEIAERYLA